MPAAKRATLLLKLSLGAATESPPLQSLQGATLTQRFQNKIAIACELHDAQPTSTLAPTAASPAAALTAHAIQPQ
jgi:hypothetical protein